LRRIAVRARAGGTPGLFWLGGFNSDMKGTKALALDAWAAEHGRACVRFDYSGHGESGGAFIEGTIGRWLEESIAIFEQSVEDRRSWSARRWAAGWRCCWRARSRSAG